MSMKRTNVTVEYLGKRYSCKELAELFDVSVGYIRECEAKGFTGQQIKDRLEKNRSMKYVNYLGTELTIPQWCKFLRCSEFSLRTKANRLIREKGYERNEGYMKAINYYFKRKIEAINKQQADLEAKAAKAKGEVDSQSPDGDA